MPPGSGSRKNLPVARDFAAPSDYSTAGLQLIQTPPAVATVGNVRAERLVEHAVAVLSALDSRSCSPVRVQLLQCTLQLTARAHVADQSADRPRAVRANALFRRPLQQLLSTRYVGTVSCERRRETPILWC